MRKASVALVYVLLVSIFSASVLEIQNVGGRLEILATNADGRETSPTQAPSMFDYPGTSDFTDKEPELVRGEVLVKFRSMISAEGLNLDTSANIDSIRDLNNQFKVTRMERVLPDLYRFTFPEQTNVFSAAREYEANPSVEYAEPNYLSHASEVPNDPYYSSQWAHGAMQSELAWTIEKGDPNIVIAVVDMGVDWNHPDLAANIWNNTDEVIDGKDNDGNGYKDDVIGYDFVDTTAAVWPGEDGRVRDNDPMGFYDFGTPCAGIAAAVANNGIGVAGMSWNCRIMPVRAGYWGSDGAIYYGNEDCTLAIRYAADNGARIVLMDFVFNELSKTLEGAIDYAYAKGCVLVAPAGDTGQLQKKSYPAALDNVIAVAATDQYDRKPYFSNYGSWVDVSAPGVSISTTVFDDTYGYWSGTSMSASFVAGLAGLILSKNPNCTNEEVRNVLRGTTDPVYSWAYAGLGRINAYKAVQRDSIPIANLNSSLDDATISGIVKINGTASGRKFQSYELWYGAGVYPASWAQIGHRQYAPVENGVLVTWDTSQAESSHGNYTIKLSVYDTDSRTSEDRAVLWVSQDPRPGPDETSEYMMGSSAVGIVFLESNGTVDPQTENWTSAEESKVIEKIKAGLDWWATQNPSANINFSYDIHYKVPTRYEPINRSSAQEGLWIREAMAYLGYRGDSYKLQARDYVNDLRQRLRTDWAFAIFVVDSSNDDDGMFADPPWFAYAYLGGPFMVMTYENNGWGIDRMNVVCAHETGHIFFATDEYDNVTEWSGYLNFPEVEHSGCLMEGEDNLRLSEGTKLQVGWRDSDSDRIPDIIDTFPEVSLKPYSPDPTGNTRLTYSGSAQVTPYTNQNPQPSDTGRAVTIAKIAKVQFRVDSENWRDAEATDGAFDDAVENFAFTTPELSLANHTIEVRAINSVGNSGYAQDTVTVVKALPPVTSFSYSPLYKNKTSTFNASESYDPDAAIASYAWNFGDGNITTTTNPITSHVYTNVGNYTVTLNVTDTQGLWQMTSANVTVCLKGDLNNDGVVGIVDVVTVAKAFGSKPGDSNWDPRLDFDGDNRVGITDVVWVATEYGAKA